MSYANIKITEASNARSLLINQPITAIDLDMNGQTLTVVEDVTVDASGTFRFYDFDALSTDQASGKIVVGDTLILTGYTLQDLVINNLDFTSVGGTATYCDVTNSTNDGGTDIDATSETNTDGGGNSGWDFGVVVVAAIRATINIFKSTLFNSLLYKK